MAKCGPQHTQKERLAIVKEGEKVGIEAVCAKYGISTQSYRTWRYKINGIKPKKQRSRKEKLRILEEGYQNGILPTCTAYGIDPTLYYYWKKNLGFTKSPRRFWMKKTASRSSIEAIEVDHKNLR